MRRIFYTILLIMCSIALSITSFRLFYKPKQLPSVHKKLLARVDNDLLYQEDIPVIIFPNSTAADVTSDNKGKFIKQYVKKWIADKLLHHKANKAIVGEERKEVEKKVADFRAGILGHVYLQHLIDQQLKLEISEEEVQTYYQTHTENFKLKNSIFKGRVIIIPKTAPQIGKVKQLLKKGDIAALEELSAYCAQNAVFYLLDNTNWFAWKDLVSQTNAKKIPHHALEKIQFLKKTYLKEIQDYSFYYYIHVEDYKSINDIAPLELVSAEINKIILHNRKIDIANSVKENILEQARPNQDYTIYDYENKN